MQWTLITLFTANAALAITGIGGKPRPPATPTSALFAVTFDVILILGIIFLWRR